MVTHDITKYTSTSKSSMIQIFGWAKATIAKNHNSAIIDYICQTPHFGTNY